MLTFIQRSVCYSVFFTLFILWTSICSDAERLFHQRDHSDLQSENQQRAEPITDPHTAEMFLSRYGFLRPVNWEEKLLDDREETDLSFLDLHEFSIEEGASLPNSRQTDENRHDDDDAHKPHDPRFLSALRDFQKLSGLPVTGVLDEATKDAMNKPRCGVPDVEAELGDENSGEKPLEVEITHDKSLGFQHLDDANVEMLDKNLKRGDSSSPEGNLQSLNDLSKETISKNHMSNETDLKNMKNSSTALENTPSYNDSYNGRRVFKLLDVLLGRMNNKDMETEGFPLNRSNQSNAFTFTNGDSNMTLRNSIVPMSNQTFIDKPDLNQTFRSSYNDSEEHLLNNNSTSFPNDFYTDLNRTASIKAENETAFDDTQKHFGDLNDFSFNNSTFSDDFTNETKSHFITSVDPVSKEATVEKMLQSVSKKENSTTDNVNFVNFTNETNLISLTFFDKIDNAPSAETKLQTIAKNSTKTKENSTIDDVNFENFTNETNLDSLTFFDKTDNATSAIAKNSTKTKENSTFDAINFVNFANETNLNSLTIFDSIDSNTTVENMHHNVNKTAFESKENSTVDNVNFENFTNESNFNSSTIFDPIDSNTIQETKHQPLVKNFTKTKEHFSIDKVNFENFTNETNLDSLTFFDKTDNATSAETKLQTIAKNSIKIEENSTIDDVNFFINETNLISLTIFDSIDSNTTVENIHQNVNKTAFESKENSTVDNINFENFTKETNLNSLTFFDKTDNATSAIAKNSTKTKENSTFDAINFVNFANETNLNSPTIFDSIDSNTTVENIHQNVNKTAFESKEKMLQSVSKKAFSTKENFTNESNFNSSTIFDPIDSNTIQETKHQPLVKNFTKTKEHFSIDKVNFENFINETNLESLTFFDKINNATSAETKLQTIAKNSTKTKENSTIDDVNFENFINETNLISLTIFDKTDNATSAIAKNSTKTKENSTFDAINFVNFANETNLNSPTIFHSIDSNTTVENIHHNVNKTAFESKENSTVDNINFENFINETNLNPLTFFDKTDNATSAETKLQTFTRNSTKTKEDSTIDDVNFENFTNETLTIFDPIDSDTTTENMHQNLDKTAFETRENSTTDNVHVENFTNETLTNFDPINNDTTLENKHQTIAKKSAQTKENSPVHSVNFINDTNSNFSTIFDSIDNDTTIENMHQNLKPAFVSKDNSTVDNIHFENFTNETNLDSLTFFDKTDNATSAETKLQTFTRNSTKTKEDSTIDDVNFENFTNETNLNPLIISDPIDNATSAETKLQTITQKPAETTELAQNSDVARRKRHLSRARRRRDVGGHVAFSKAVLRWRLIGEGYSSQLSVEEQRYVFRLAFRMWSEVCPLEFTEDNASPLEEIDIRLGFGTGRHLGCKQRFDGSGREFAHAWFLGDIHFDDDEHFSGSSAGRGISLLKVAVHEIGHVLGLPHIYRAGSIMQPSYRPHESGFEVDWMDRKAIQSLYGGCKGRFDTVFDWVRRERSPRGELLIRFNTYFMRQGWYWLYENRNNRTRFGDPVSLQSGWRGLPLDGVDAFVHVWSRRRDHVYFFKGAQFWRYDGEQDQVLRHDPDGRSYPRPISEGFPGVPAPIDTAVYDRRDGNIYFFKGRLVYAFSVDSNRLTRGFPRPLRSVFPALDPRDHPESGLDAAYFSYTHNALFLLKDTRFWRVVGAREQRTRPRLQKNTLLPHRDIEEQWFDICNVHPTTLRLNP